MAPHGIRVRHRRPDASGEQRDPGSGGVVKLWKIDGSDVLLRARARHECFEVSWVEYVWRTCDCKRHVISNLELTHVAIVLPRCWLRN